MSFINITDFVGEFNISQNKYAMTDYNAIITATEEAVLKDLLGEDLYLKLIADLDGSYVPQTAKYLELVNGKTYSVINGDGVTVNVNYQGIKKMLKYFTYVELLKHQETENTEVGQVEPLQNNSQRVGKHNLSFQICNSYNKGLALYGYDIYNYGYRNAFISNYNSKPKNYYKYDYYLELVKGSCFNYLYYCYENYATYFPTWQFTPRCEMLLNGYL